MNDEAREFRMKVAALTSGRNVPSARFRVRQYLSHLRSSGIEVTEYCPRLSQGARLPGALGRIRSRYVPPLAFAQMLANAAFRVPGIAGSRSADVTWLERNFAPGLDDLAVALKPPIVLDIDDAIWLYSPFGAGAIRRLVRRANVVFAGNRFLADWCSDLCPRVRLVPTAIDTGRFIPREAAKKDGAPFVLGWTGTSGNFRYLRLIEAALAAFLHAHRDAALLVVADERPNLPSVPTDQFYYAPWSPQIENQVLQEMDVGLMPLEDNDLARGKCSFKMLQYMAAGIPCVVSPVGMNSELLELGEIGFGPTDLPEWRNALDTLYESATLRAQMGAQGRKVACEGFDTSVVAAKIAEYLRDCAR